MIIKGEKTMNYRTLSATKAKSIPESELKKALFQLLDVPYPSDEQIEVVDILSDRYEKLYYSKGKI